MKWTLVRHTGYSVAGKLAFKNAVEERCVVNGKEERAVLKAGGMLFDSYVEARLAAERENYNDDNDSLVPHVSGTFHGTFNNEELYHAREEHVSIEQAIGEAAEG